MKKTTRIGLYLWLSSILFTATAQEQLEHPTLPGTWAGSFAIGLEDDTNLAFVFDTEDGEYTASLMSTTLGIYGLPADSFSIRGLNLTIRIRRMDLEFTGTLRYDEAGEKIVRIDGDWFQRSEMIPLVLHPAEAN